MGTGNERFSRKMEMAANFEKICKHIKAKCLFTHTRLCVDSVTQR